MGTVKTLEISTSNFQGNKALQLCQGSSQFVLSSKLSSIYQTTQLLWSRCVNTRGVKGANIPADLHNEHLNRCLKSVIAGQGTNVNPDSVVKAGKVIRCVHQVCQAFEKKTATTTPSNHHSFPDFGYFSDIMKVLEEENVFHLLDNTAPSQLEKFSYKRAITRI